MSTCLLKAAQQLSTHNELFVIGCFSVASALQVVEGVNDTAENFLSAIERNEPEIAPSSLYGAACVQEGVAFINGAPQNTFVPGLIDLAVKRKVCASA